MTKVDFFFDTLHITNYDTLFSKFVQSKCKYTLILVNILFISLMSYSEKIYFILLLLVYLLGIVQH